MLYSKELQTFDGVIPYKIKEAIQVLCRHYSIDNPTILRVGNSHIAIPAEVTVSIPPKGTVGGIDIREKEPILIRFNLSTYPDTPPVVVSDRKDFPRHHLSHLYASPSDDPPAKLCLVRGDLGEWFSRNRMENLLEVTDQWFFKAAIGQLNVDGNEFDPLRLDSYAGYHVYRYSQFKKVIQENTTFLPGKSFGCFITIGKVEQKDDEIDTIFKTELPVQAASIGHILEKIKKVQSNNGTQDKIIDFLTILIWHPDETVDESYTTEFPTNYGALCSYFQKSNVDIDVIIRELINQKYITKESILITHAIKRPKKVIGFDGPYEFLNFRLVAKQNKRGGVATDSRVTILNHIEPFSSELAIKITGESRITKNLFIGAGSLGAKVALHFGRSGNAFIGICDNDPLLQHNLARHPLFANHVGRNKAIALVDELESMFEFTPQKSIQSFPGKVFHLPDETINLYEWIIDTTASITVRNWLVEKNFSPSMQIARCELADQGKLGLLYIEGKNRNPRIDDLSNLAIFRALKYPALEAWRKADAIRGEQTLDIGLGCSSVTSVMPDDRISLHAAAFSQIVYSQKERVNIKEQGLFYFQAINDQGIPDPYSKYEIVSPFNTYQCRQGSGWEIRLYPGLKNYMLSQCKKYKPKETGGVLIGVCNYKTKTIHVFEVLNGPPDSKRTSTSFIRGKQGLPQQIEHFKEKTGGVIGYIGEWHTHPMQLETLSGKDKQTIEKLLPKNRQEPIPTLSLIVTNTDLLPFVFL